MNRRVRVVDATAAPLHAGGVRRDASGRYTIAEDPLECADVLELLRLHLDEMHSASPACKVHAMPPARLREGDVTFYAVRARNQSGNQAGNQLAAIGALKSLGDQRAEIKSMRAAPAFRRQGAGVALLRHIIAQAQARGYSWLGLETGRTAEFEAARLLYEAHGFRECPAFDGYTSDQFSMCMEREL